MNQEYFVDCQWLAQQLNNPQIVIVDCRFNLGGRERASEADRNWGWQQYSHSHIPGAYYLDLDRDLSSGIQVHGGRHPLPDIEQLGAKLASIGIVQNKTLVVAYDSSRFAFAARLWWLLRYLGHDQVALLDGGWNAWQSGGYPVTTTVPPTQTGFFEPQPHDDWIVEIEQVKTRKNNPGVILVDSREHDRYTGIREPIDPIAGHIPGAVNSPWQLVSDQDGYILPTVNQEQLWSDYTSAEEIIVYCGSGITACVNLLSLKLAGIEQTKLYPGGWSDWCSYLTQ
jgi:thiosulfate/3-mercaptopyruvate sulfurtransferase